MTLAVESANSESATLPARRFAIDGKIAAAILIALLIVAALANWIAPYDYATQFLSDRLKPPYLFGGTLAHPLGTDNLGRDVLSRLIYGLQTSMLIAIGGTVIGGVLGTSLGAIAAQFRGWPDELVMMLVDIQASVPYIILALAFLAFFGNSLSLFIILVGIEGWERYARLTRGLARSAREADYVGAVIGLGGRPLRVFFRHILPNIAATLVVQATINFPEKILLETSISFLGLGVQPPMTSLGAMLGQGRLFLLNAPWIALAPGLTIVATTLVIGFLGDRLRDYLDPTLEGKA